MQGGMAALKAAAAVGAGLRDETVLLAVYAVFYGGRLPPLRIGAGLRGGTVVLAVYAVFYGGRLPPLRIGAGLRGGTVVLAGFAVFYGGRLPPLRIGAGLWLNRSWVLAVNKAVWAYILSGALMPMRLRAWAMVCLAALVRARRAALAPGSSSRMRRS